MKPLSIEIVEDWHGKKSTLLASQIPVGHWHSMIGEGWSGWSGEGWLIWPADAYNYLTSFPLILLPSVEVS